ncbi:N-acetyltransferase [Paenibacillus faecalis]|uniref:N-acetyltransferase n=1 Tax=Paenibacillus faecalis TaxID=2079532 RepID=UPI001F28862E|nr:N-acetyltransferase [Paenibacillus faecalis]
MEISSILPDSSVEWPDIRQQCYDFLCRFGSRRLSSEGCSILQNMHYDQLQLPGTSLIAATVRGELGKIPVGICFTAGFGEDACLIAVHPLYRKRRIGTSLILFQLSKLKHMHCNVAIDHIQLLRCVFMPVCKL